MSMSYLFDSAREVLVDECLPVRLAEALCACGHDAVHVVERGLNGKPDTDVMALAVDENRIMLSADTDFGAARICE